MKEERYFTNKYQQKIYFIEGYFDRFKNRFINYHKKVGFSKEQKIEEGKLAKEKKKKLSYDSFLHRHARTAVLKQMLEKYELRNFRCSLDVGTSHALIPRLMKAFGIVKKAVGLDIIDRSYQISSKEILRYEKMLKRRHFINRLARSISLGKRILFYDHFVSTYSEFGFQLNERSMYPKIVNRNLKLDNMIVGDIYNHAGEYDLITFFCSDNYFDINSLFQKCSSLLVEKGVLFMYVNSWWDIINHTLLPGHFPYAVTRLEKDDWIRYCKQYHSDCFEDMLKTYECLENYNLTVSQYIKLASDHGLVLVGYDRCIHNAQHSGRSKLSANYIESFFDDSYLNEVLSNIRMFRDDIRIEDLQTSGAFLVFQKKENKGRIEIDEEFIQKMDNAGKYPDRMTSLKIKIKELVRRFVGGS
jgi:SAM-dependent methyltransferase